MLLVMKIMAVTSANPSFQIELEALNVNVGIDLEVIRPASQKNAAFTGVMSPLSLCVSTKKADEPIFLKDSMGVF
jgi:hypothetical protein